MFAADRASWQNPRILALLFSIFLFGGVVGALTMRTTLHERMHKSPGSGSASGSASYWKDEKTQFFSYDKLKRELNLTPEQSDRLKTILDDFVKYHEDVLAQIEDVRATGKNRIKQMLTPEQRKRFDELCNQLQSQ